MVIAGWTEQTNTTLQQRMEVFERDSRRQDPRLKDDDKLCTGRRYRHGDCRVRSGGRGHLGPKVVRSSMMAARLAVWHKVGLDHPFLVLFIKVETRYLVGYSCLERQCLVRG